MQKSLVTLLLLLCAALPVHASAQPIGKLVVIWRADCLPCQGEIPMLIRQAQLHKDLPIIILSLQDRAIAQSHLPADMPPNMQLQIAGANATELLKQYGDARKVLPLSVFFHANGSVCNAHQGMLGTDQINLWLKGC